VKLGTSKPYWVLAADSNARFIPEGWGYDGHTPGNPDQVPHPKLRSKSPEGGNQLAADGSVKWVKFEDMYFLTTWNQNRRLFAYQDNLEADLRLKLPTFNPAQINLLKPQQADF
jgi:hypothetical protein